jgi:hypothetical protein
MPESIGPHLLGRVHSIPDLRDWDLADFLTDDPLDQALAVLVASGKVAAPTKAWAKVATAAIHALQPAPIPTPPPPTTDVVWSIPTILNQGDTPHCVGFGWAQWGNSDPVEDNYTDADGNAIYYECKVIDGEPGAEDGSNVRSGAQAMQNRKRLSAYAFASNVSDAEAWVRKNGPVVMGTDWTNDMFNPDVNGYIAPTGGVAGGHCYVMSGVLDSEDAYLFDNSWDVTWGLGGKFKMKKADFVTLFADGGEACASLELPL